MATNLLPSFNLHIREILDFLKTVTIKFSYFENLLNEKYSYTLDILTEDKLNFNPEIPFVDLYIKDQIDSGIVLSVEQQINSCVFSDDSPIIDSAYIGKNIFGTNRKDIINKVRRDVVLSKEIISLGLVDEDNRPIIKNIKYSYPYYINMNGEYHSANEMMSIYSITTDSSMDLTKENLKNDPITKDLYLTNTSLMNGLYTKYPDQVDLIKAIFYPISDIDTAIGSEDLTLLGYDIDILHPNERESISLSIMEFLSHIEYRWYLNVYEYENLYPLAFWSMLWYLLFNTILTKRILNMKTNQAHPYHVWEYLESKGLKGYKGFLTDEQSLFLYRNINYLKRNKGKKFILDILENELIKPFNHALVSKVIYHGTEGRRDYADWYPEVLELTKNKGLINELETIPMFQTLLYDQGFDPDNNPIHIEDVEKKFSGGKDNILKTKFFEIIKASSNNFEESFFLRYLYDTIANLHANNKLGLLISLTDPVDGNVNNINISTALAVLNYCFLRCSNNGFISHLDFLNYLIPTSHNCTAAIRFMEKPTDYPMYFYVNENRFDSKNYIDIDEFYNSVEYPTSIIDTTEELSDLVLSQYSFIINNFKKLRYDADMIKDSCIRKQLYHIVPKFITSYYSPFVVYRDFFSANPEIFNLINNRIKEETESKDAIKLIYEIFDAICPLTSELLKFMKIVNNSDIFWEKVRDLFINLSSYNVSYILRNKDNPLTFNLSHTKMYPYMKLKILDRFFDSSVLGCNYMEFNFTTLKKINKSMEIDIEKDIEQNSKTIVKNFNIGLLTGIKFNKAISENITLTLGNQLTIN